MWDRNDCSWSRYQWYVMVMCSTYCTKRLKIRFGRIVELPSLPVRLPFRRMVTIRTTCNGSTKEINGAIKLKDVQLLRMVVSIRTNKVFGTNIYPYHGIPYTTFSWEQLRETNQFHVNLINIKLYV